MDVATRICHWTWTDQKWSDQMKNLSKNNVSTVQTIDHDNMYDFPSEEYCKWSSDGEWVHLNRVFENGQILFSRFDMRLSGLLSLSGAEHLN
jgi:hypothetical protein